MSASGQMFARNIIIGMLLAGFGCQAQTQNQKTNSEFWPEIDGYLQLNTVTRLLLLTSFSDDQETRSWEGDFGAHLDFALKPVFRRDLDAREDVFERRFLSFRAGFRYITSLGNSDPAYLEHRWVIEMTSKLPMPGQLVLIERNRGEMRVINTKGFSTRYRNKLQMERGFKIGGFRFTPYIYGELFYDTRYDKWNRNRYAVGARFPVRRQFVPEVYFLRQNDSRASDAHVNAFGITLNLYF